MNSTIVQCGNCTGDIDIREDFCAKRDGIYVCGACVDEGYLDYLAERADADEEYRRTRIEAAKSHSRRVWKQYRPRQTTGRVLR